MQPRSRPCSAAAGAQRGPLLHPVEQHRPRGVGRQEVDERRGDLHEPAAVADCGRNSEQRHSVLSETALHLARPLSTGEPAAASRILLHYCERAKHQDIVRTVSNHLCYVCNVLTSAKNAVLCSTVLLRDIIYGWRQILDGKMSILELQEMRLQQLSCVYVEINQVTHNTQRKPSSHSSQMSYEGD